MGLLISWTQEVTRDPVLRLDSEGVPWWLSGLRIQHCPCCSVGLIPGPGTFLSCWHSQKQRKDMTVRGLPRNSGLAGFLDHSGVKGDPTGLRADEATSGAVGPHFRGHEKWRSWPGTLGAKNRALKGLVCKNGEHTKAP